MSFHQRLEHNTFVTVRSPIGSTQLSAAAERFLEFLELPTKILRSLHVPSKFPNGTADGYTDKRDSSSHDRKQYFHWSPRLERLTCYQAALLVHPRAKRFFEEAAIIYDAAERTAVRLFERHFPEKILATILKNGRIASAELRFLAYAPQAGPFSARGHYDKCPGALALAESSPGLRIGRDDRSLQLVRHQEGTCIFMPGIMLYEDMEGAILPAWHDVVQDPDTSPLNSICARWAIVFFINRKDGSFTSFEKAHTPVS